jgi:outer membrane immunogenic protein
MNLLRGGVIGSAMVACISMAAVSAAAADKGGPRYAEPSFNSIWRGLYGGVHLGYGEAGDADGVLGGAQVGYNWQMSQIVYGLEADFSVADISVGRSSIDWLGTVRGRVGYLLDPRLLAYATAGVGLANGNSDTETDFVLGLGVEGKLTETMSARIEYLSYSDLDIDVVRAGLNFKLGR